VKEQSSKRSRFWLLRIIPRTPSAEKSSVFAEEFSEQYDTLLCDLLFDLRHGKSCKSSLVNISVKKLG
jgi:hypothetical protein